MALFVVNLQPVLAQEPLPPAPAHYLAPEISTAGAAVAVGSDGVVHMAGATYNHGGDGAAIYARCDADCAEPKRWTQVALPVGDVVRVEIAVTPAGAPRLLIMTRSTIYPGGRDFLYAECGAQTLRLFPARCDDAEAWTIVRIASNQESSMGDFFELLLPRHSFALDGRGNPRFIFTDSNYTVEPDRYGAYFMTCDGGCLDPANWTEANLANQLEYRTEQFTRPALAIGADGSAHVLAWVYGFEPDGTAVPNDLFYYECPADCGARENWRRTAVINPGGGSYPSPSWDLAVDAQGRPRAAAFIGGGSTEPDLDYSLIYFWCDDACTVEDSWAGQIIESESFGEGPAIALDAEGRPSIAFLSPDALPALARCSADCQGDAAAWTSRYLEGEPDMAADRPTALPFTCDAELWNAMMPDLAVGPGGDAYVGYDVSVEARCLYREFLEPEITYEFHEIWHGVRLALPPTP